MKLRDKIGNAFAVACVIGLAVFMADVYPKPDKAEGYEQARRDRIDALFADVNGTDELSPKEVSDLVPRLSIEEVGGLQ